MRDLTMREIEEVSGGSGTITFYEGLSFHGAGYLFVLDGAEFDGRSILVSTAGQNVDDFMNDIVVTAHKAMSDLDWGDINSFVIANNGLIGGNIAGLGGGGAPAGPVQAHATANVSNAANQFADQHVHNNGTTQLDQDAAQKVHDTLAKEYDKLSANPGGIVAVVPGDDTHPSTTVHASDVLAALGKAVWNITDSIAYNVVGQNGAATNTVTNETNINPQLLTAQGIALTSADGISQIVDHELAHRVIEAYVPQEALNTVGTSANESDASLMRSYIELWLNPPSLN